MIVSSNRLLKSNKPENLHIAMYEGSSFERCNQFSGFLFGRNRMGKVRREKKKQLIFYVYIILDSYNKPMYIGKGHKNRVLGSNGKFRRKTIYKILFSRLIEKEAFKLEHDLIMTIGRKDKGDGPLLNKTDGGEGPAGLIFSDEHKRKIGLANKG
jgi:hypothetical protein